MNRFKDKVVLVTGGNRNTGLDIVEKFEREGAKVFMCGSSAESTAKGVEKLRQRGLTNFTAQACDVGNISQVNALMDLIEREAGRLDILVNNAADQGLGLGGPLEMNPESILKVMTTNVKGGFQVTQAACNRFFIRKQVEKVEKVERVENVEDVEKEPQPTQPSQPSQPVRGVVVFLSSNTAQRAIRNRTAYCASKGAINSMVRSLALDLAPLGVRVNACAPGYIYTERWDALDEQTKARRRLNCPLRIEAKGSDIANVVAFLASEDSGNMTGEIVTCDAGCSCQHMPEDVDM